MIRYKKRLKEETSLSKLTDPKVVDKLFEFFKDNPYPQDDSGVHKFAEDLGMEADDLEMYIYAIVSCFISGGNFNKKKAKVEDFSKEEIDMGMIVEEEHVDMKTDNEVVKRIAELMRQRIVYDHQADNDKYYAEGKAGTLSLEELTK